MAADTTATTPPLCTRCREQEGVLDLRSDAVCRTCFAAFVASKTIKRLEVLQRETRGAKLPSRPQRYLLALSRGPSSTALLHILDENVRRQRERNGRVKFELVVVFVDVDVDVAEPAQKSSGTAGSSSTPINGDVTSPANTSSSSPSSSTPAAKDETPDPFTTYFPNLTIHTTPLSNILSSPAIDWSHLPAQNASLSPSLRLADFFARLPSATARADVSRLLIRHALYAAARAHECAVILLGYTTTALAELTLSEAAKGRGFGIPWFVNDGAFPLPRAIPKSSLDINGVTGELASMGLGEDDDKNGHDGTDKQNGNGNGNGNATPAASASASASIHIYSPLREIFRKEILTYLSIVPISSSSSPPSSSSSTPTSPSPITPPSLATALLPPSLQSSPHTTTTTTGGNGSTTSNSTSSSSTTPAVISHRDLSLDDVVTRFFTDVEASYPSVVANVVRTTGKLNRLTPTIIVTNSSGVNPREIKQEKEGEDADTVIAGRQCRLCGVGLDPLGDERWKGEIGEADDDDGGGGGGTGTGTTDRGENEQRSRLCYGCERSVRG